MASLLQKAAAETANALFFFLAAAVHHDPFSIRKGGQGSKWMGPILRRDYSLDEK